MTAPLGAGLSALARAVYAADTRANPVQLWTLLAATIAMLTAWIGITISSLRSCETAARDHVV